MAYDPRKDPYYSDLFDDNQVSFASMYNDQMAAASKQEAQRLQNEIAEQKLEEQKAELEKKERVKESLQNASFDDPDIYLKAQEAYGKEGDIEKVIELQRLREAAEARQQSQESTELSMIDKVDDPEVKAAMWNRSTLATKYGQKTAIDPYFQRAQELGIGPDGTVYDKRSLVAGQKIPGYREKGESSIKRVEYFNPATGSMVSVNIKDPNVQRQIDSGELLPPSAYREIARDSYYQQKEEAEKAAKKPGASQANPIVLPKAKLDALKNQSGNSGLKVKEISKTK